MEWEERKETGVDRERPGDTKQLSQGVLDWSAKSLNALLFKYWKGGGTIKSTLCRTPIYPFSAQLLMVGNWGDAAEVWEWASQKLSWKKHLFFFQFTKATEKTPQTIYRKEYVPFPGHRPDQISRWYSKRRVEVRGLRAPHFAWPPSSAQETLNNQIISRFNSLLRTQEWSH